MQRNRSREGVNHMEISVIIPYKHYIGYLRECLQSLKEQTFKDFEIIISYHQAATSDIELIKNEVKFEQIQFINCKNSNVASARNEGLKRATGTYICFLDSDDYLLPDTFATWIDHLKSSPMKIDILFGALKANSLKYESFLTDFYEYQTVFTTNAKLDVVIKDKSQLTGRKFDSRTVLGKLFKREFLMARDVKFKENLDFYSDLPFLLEVLDANPKVSGTKDTLYVQRLHSDAISMPSLDQELGSKKPIALATAYLEATKTTNANSKVKKSLDQYLCNYFWNEVVGQLAKEKSKDVSLEILEALNAVSVQINAEVIRNLPSKQKKFMKQLQNKNYEAALKYTNFAMQVVDFKAGIKSGMEFKKYLYNNWLTKLKTKKRVIVFESFLGRQYSCNPKAIYEYMKENHPEYKFYWSIDPKQKQNFEGLQTIERFSFKWLYVMARAQYWVINSRLPLWLSKPKGTTYLQTWHGTPLKKLVFDVEEVYMPGTTTEKYKQNFYTESRNWDYLISPNAYSSHIFKSAFRFDKEMLEYGYPRNDVLYTGDNEENIKRLKTELGISLHKKVILYAPTFRDNQFYKSGNYKFDLPMDLANLKERYGKDCIILLRMHYLVAENFDLGPYKGFAFDFSNRADINDLYLVSDLLITDYSSVFFDYANLRRPIAFYTYDLDEYRETLRGFYFDLVKEAPGPIVESEPALIETLDEFMTTGQFNHYKTQYETFTQKYCYLDDGFTSKEVVDHVFKK